MKTIETGKIQQTGNMIYLRLPKKDYENRVGEEVVIEITPVEDLLK